MQGAPPEEQRGVSNRPGVVVHHVGRLGPRRLVFDERVHELEGPAHAAPIGRHERPEIVLRGRQRLGHHRHHIELEQGVAVGLGPRELPREAAIGSHLLGDQRLLEESPHRRELRLVAHKPREGSHLQRPRRRVVVAALPLIKSVLMGGDPLEVASEPVLSPREHLLLQVPEAFEHPSGPRDLDEVNRIDDAGAPPGGHALDRLTVQQIGIHTRPLVHEPRPQMRRGLAGVALVARDAVSGDERGHDQAESPQRIAVGDEVVRVRLAVAPHVRAARVRRVGPPVIALRVEVVRSCLRRAASRRHGERRDRDGRLAQIPIGGGEHAAPLDSGEIVLERGPRRAAQRRGWEGDRRHAGQRRSHLGRERHRCAL